jgi:hypothetical protein
MSTSIKRVIHAVLSLLLVTSLAAAAVQPAYAYSGHGYAYGKTTQTSKTHSDNSYHSNKDSKDSKSNTQNSQNTYQDQTQKSNTSSKQNVPGDNGTVKIHGLDTPTCDHRNVPKVCDFYLDAFGFDSQQSVDWKIVTNTHGTTVLSGSITLVNGAGHTGTLTLPNGMYKLYWNFNGEHGSAKHKVFKVECPTEQPPVIPPVDHSKPSVKAKSNTCVVTGQKSGSLTVTVTNPTSKQVVYLVSVGNQSQRVVVAANSSQDVTFTNLTAGKYTVTVYQNGCKKLSTDVTIDTCPTTPTPPVGRGGGVVLGETTTKPAAVLANTGDTSLTATFIASLLVSAGLLIAFKRTSKLASQAAIEQISL